MRQKLCHFQYESLYSCLSFGRTPRLAKILQVALQLTGEKMTSFTMLWGDEVPELVAYDAKELLFFW